MSRPRLFKSPVLIVDTETTGFVHHPWARVVELAAIVIDERGFEADHYTTLVKPDIFDAKQAAGAIKVHGITPEAVAKHGIPTDEAVANLDNFVRYYFDEGAAWTTSFNIDFDRPMVARMGDLDLQWVPAACIMKWAMRIMGPAGVLPRRRGGTYKYPKLSEALGYFGLSFRGDAHRALTDTRAAAEVMVALRAREMGVELNTEHRREAS